MLRMTDVGSLTEQFGSAAINAAGVRAVEDPLDELDDAFWAATVPAATKASNDKRTDSMLLVTCQDGRRQFRLELRRLLWPQGTGRPRL